MFPVLDDLCIGFNLETFNVFSSNVILLTCDVEGNFAL